MSLQTDFFTIVQERRSVKHYDASFKLSRQETKQLLEIANSAPSAWNLQHWKFIVIDNEAAKQKLLPIAYNQKQIVEASVVVAILGDLQANLNTRDVYQRDVQSGQLSEQIMLNIIDQIESAYAEAPTFSRDEAIRNASLAAMQLMLAAKAKGLDSCPMGGYDVAKFIEAFHIPARYVPVMLISIGKPAAPARASARYPVENKIVWNSF